MNETNNVTESDVVQTLCSQLSKAHAKIKTLECRIKELEEENKRLRSGEQPALPSMQEAKPQKKTTEAALKEVLHVCTIEEIRESVGEVFFSHGPEWVNETSVIDEAVNRLELSCSQSTYDNTRVSVTD